jgi:hypothetical protein
MSDELRQAIQQTATGPKRVRTDAGEVESQDISQQIEADKYLSAKAAAAKNHRGLRFSTIVPPGSV